MKSPTDKSLRDHILYLLSDGGAHAGFDATISGLPAKLRGRIPAGQVHSPWMLLEHLRLTQWDILDFSRNPKYKEMKWPEAYWPKTPAPPSAAAWNTSVKKFKRDLKAMQRLVADPKTDLFAKIPWGNGQTILREAMLIADHNSYHIGQMVGLRRGLRSWG